VDDGRSLSLAESGTGTGRLARGLPGKTLPGKSSGLGFGFGFGFGFGLLRLVLISGDFGPEFERLDSGLGFGRSFPAEDRGRWYRGLASVFEGVEAIFSKALISCEVGGINVLPLFSADIGLK
jgi:hypothetical protein